MSNPTFHPDHSSAGILLAWHRSLEEDRGGRALLRRADGPDAVAFVPAYHRLLHQLEREGLRIWRESIASIAGIAARVTAHEGGAGLALKMGRPREKGGAARVSDGRFRRLLASPDHRALYPQLSRAIHLLGDTVNLLDLARSVYFWTTETKKRWAYDYYSAAPTAK